MIAEDAADEAAGAPASDVPAAPDASGGVDETAPIESIDAVTESDAHDPDADLLGRPAADPADVASLDAAIAEEADAVAEDDVAFEPDEGAAPADAEDVVGAAGDAASAPDAAGGGGAPEDALAAMGFTVPEGVDKAAALRKVRAALAAKVKARSDGQGGDEDPNDPAASLSPEQMAEMMAELDRALADGVDTLLDSSYETIAGLLDSVFDEDSIVAPPEADLVPDEDEPDEDVASGDGEAMLPADDDGPDLAREQQEADEAQATEPAPADAAADVPSDTADTPEAAAGAEPSASVVDPEDESDDGVPAGMLIDDDASLSGSDAGGTAPAGAAEEDPLESAAEMAAVEDLEGEFDSVDLDEPMPADAGVATGAGPAAGQPGETAAEPVGGGLAARLEPPVRSALELLARPLERIPPTWRPTVDWIAISLAFWVPVTWVLALLLI